MKLTFSGTGAVAPPTVTPAPGAGEGGKTLGELLRPVGESTWWLGDVAQIPPGWLLLDGSTYDVGTYPKLAAHLAASGLVPSVLAAGVLPDLTDRMPIGAGTKALATTGGSPTATLAPGNYRHTHALGSSSNDNTSTGGSANRVTSVDSETAEPTPSGTPNVPFSIMPPWFAAWPIIRAA